MTPLTICHYLGEPRLFRRARRALLAPARFKTRIAKPNPCGEKNQSGDGSPPPHCCRLSRLRGKTEDGRRRRLAGAVRDGLPRVHAQRRRRGLCERRDAPRARRRLVGPARRGGPERGRGRTRPPFARAGEARHGVERRLPQALPAAALVAVPLGQRHRESAARAFDATLSSRRGRARGPRIARDEGTRRVRTRAASASARSDGFGIRDGRRNARIAPRRRSPGSSGSTARGSSTPTRTTRARAGTARRPTSSAAGSRRRARGCSYWSARASGSTSRAS